MERVSPKEKSRSEISQGDVLMEDNMSASRAEFVVLEYRKRSLVLSKRFSMSWLDI